MTWLFESYVSIIALGAVLIFFLSLAWVQTGQNGFLFGAGGAIALVAVLLGMERYVETDREAVERTLHTIAADLESNNAERLAEHIVQSKPELKLQAQSEMTRHIFTSVVVGTIHHVEVNPNHQPPEVDIEFNVTVGGSFFNTQFVREGEQRWVRLVFWKEEDGQWRIADYEHDQPGRFMKKRRDQ